MKGGDYILILWPLPLILHCLGVLVIGQVNSSVMTDWFDAIPGLDYDHDNQYWDPTGKGPVFDWHTKWRGKALESYLKTLDEYKDYPIGKIKGLKDRFLWFTEDADSMVTQIGNKTWYSESNQYRKMVMGSLYKKWNSCVDTYYPSKEGEIEVAVKSGSESIDKLPLDFKLVPFGPSLFWSESDWDGIQRQWELKLRKDERDSHRKNDDQPQQLRFNPSQAPRSNSNSNIPSSILLNPSNNNSNNNSNNKSNNNSSNNNNSNNQPSTESISFLASFPSLTKFNSSNPNQNQHQHQPTEQKDAETQSIHSDQTQVSL